MWLAATIDRRAFERALGVGADEVMPAVSPIGYAAERRSVLVTPDQSQPWKDSIFNLPKRPSRLACGAESRLLIQSLAFAEASCEEYFWLSR